MGNITSKVAVATKQAIWDYDPEAEDNLINGALDVIAVVCTLTVKVSINNYTLWPSWLVMRCYALASAALWRTCGYPPRMLMRYCTSSMPGMPHDVVAHVQPELAQLGGVDRCTVLAGAELLAALVLLDGLHQWGLGGWRLRGCSRDWPVVTLTLVALLFCGLLAFVSLARGLVLTRPLVPMPLSRPKH